MKRKGMKRNKCGKLVVSEKSVKKFLDRYRKAGDNGDTGKSGANMKWGTLSKDFICSMIAYLKRKYAFRYNSVMKYTEYLEKGTEDSFMPLEPRTTKRMTLEVQLNGIPASSRDVRNFIESDMIADYDPIGIFLGRCRGKWNGEDHIRRLADTVPTENRLWRDWFYRWFLGMVDQWRCRSDRKYGNSLVPLLVSAQGFNKSTFCRRLLPPELQWGFNDNIILEEKKQVLQAMSQFLLINIDEFNQISAKQQEGFLKNLLQLPHVKIKRPYGSHVEEFPRLASFIATSNIKDVLSDPSGSRRFICIDLSAPIAVDSDIDYEQLYAQALTALDRGERCFLNMEETRLLMRNNEDFQNILPIEQCFKERFLPTDDEKAGKYLTTTEIYSKLKAQYGGGFDIKGIARFGRRLSAMSGLIHRRTRKGTEYLVVDTKEVPC